MQPHRHTDRTVVAQKRRKFMCGCFCAVCIFIVAGSAAGCRSKQPMPLDQAMRLIDQRPAWTHRPPINVPRHPAEKFLRGWMIVLDPGHGGEDGGAVDPRTTHKRGPTGVREADMNWRVAVLLKRLLDDAGANVILTRNGDQTVSLAQRAQVANDVKADLFISLHHNAVENNPRSNYSSVWYHGQVDWSEAELDVADSIARELGKALRTDVARTSPIFSDQLMYDGGFGVLRMCNVPAVLCESSFYSNPDEEQRLRDAGYNLREAYAIYVGLCEYAYGGRPTQSTPRVLPEGSQMRLTTTLNEGLPPWWGSARSRILASSINVTLDGQPVPFEFEPQTKRLQAVLPLVSQAELSIRHANMFKHSNHPQRYRLLGSAGGVVRVEPLGPRRAAPGSAPATTRASS